MPSTARGYSLGSHGGRFGRKIFSTHTNKKAASMGDLFISNYLCVLLFKWCRHQESNPGPTDYKSVALPTELCRRGQLTNYKYQMMLLNLGWQWLG